MYILYPAPHETIVVIWKDEQVHLENQESSHYMSWEIVWAMVFLCGNWSKHSPGEISVVIITLGWTKFELLEEKKKIINHSATPPYDHTINAVILLLLPL